MIGALVGAVTGAVAGFIAGGFAGILIAFDSRVDSYSYTGEPMTPSEILQDAISEQFARAFSVSERCFRQSVGC